MIIVEGNLTDTATLEGDQKNPRLKFTVAQNERRKNPHTGEWEDGDTTFWNVTLWGRKALNAAPVLSKGTPVLVHGKRAKVRTYERRDGGIGFSAEINAETVGLIPRNQQQQSTGGFAQSQGFDQMQPTPAAQDPWGGGTNDAGSPPF